MAVLDVIASGALLGFAAWLFIGARASVNAEEHAIRLQLAKATFGAAGWFLLVWAFVERRWVAARVLQFLTGALLLPLFPLGTVWGAYTLWALTWRGARDAFGRSARASARPGPYWGAVTLATIVGLSALTFAAVRGRTAWLELQVESASEHAAERQEAISHTVQKLRDHGILE